MDWFEVLAKLMVILAMGAGTAVLVRAAVFGGWRHRRGVASGADLAELTQLREAVERLNGEVAELQERVDFTERVLAQQREAGKLPQPGR